MQEISGKRIQYSSIIEHVMAVAVLIT